MNFNYKTSEIGINTIISEIQHDIQIMKHKMNIPEERIKVSIPKFFLTIMEMYLEKIYFQEFEIKLKKTLFGAEIVEGYNNQICVFDEMATFDSDKLKPITLIRNSENELKIER